MANKLKEKNQRLLFGGRDYQCAAVTHFGLFGMA
jgi:hypothetical protein